MKTTIMYQLVGGLKFKQVISNYYASCYLLPIQSLFHHFRIVFNEFIQRPCTMPKQCTPNAKKLKFHFTECTGADAWNRTHVDRRWDWKANAKPTELRRPSNVTALIFLYKPNVILLFKLLVELTFYTNDDKL